MEENNPVQPNSEIENQTPPEQTSRPIYKNKFFLGFVAISVLAAFLIGGFALGKSSTKSTPFGSPKPTAQAATPDPNDISNWTEADFTQTNGISFSYPNDWRLGSSGTPNNTITQIAVLSNEKDQPNNVLINISMSTTKGTSIEKENSSNSYQVWSNIKILNKILFFFQTYPAIKFQMADSGNGTFSEITEFIKDGALFSIAITANNQKNLNDNLEIYNKVVSTFTFTNPTGSLANPGEPCGGNIASAKQCTSGYHCQLEKIVDGGGNCVKD